MIRASRSFAISALAVSAALHASGVGLFVPAEQTARTQGGAPVSAVRLGNSFQDVAQGSLRPSPPATRPKAVTADTQAARVKPRNPAEPLRAKTSMTATRAANVVSASTATSDVPTPAARSETPRSDLAATIAATGSPADTAMDAPRPVTQAQAADPASASEPPEPATLTALPGADDPAPVHSARPRTRPRSVAEHARRSPADRPTKTQATPPPTSEAGAGSDAPDQVRGSADGQRDAAQAQVSDRRAAAREAGNAAASNYPGQVMRAIARQRRPSVNSRGTATVSFQIAASGALAGATLARSSGSSALDRAALDLVRRAAPFPPPPAGARRSFTIGVEGR